MFLCISTIYLHLSRSQIDSQLIAIISTWTDFPVPPATSSDANGAKWYLRFIKQTKMFYQFCKHKWNPFGRIWLSIHIDTPVFLCMLTDPFWELDSSSESIKTSRGGRALQRQSNSTHMAVLDTKPNRFSRVWMTEKYTLHENPLHKADLTCI